MTVGPLGLARHGRGVDHVGVGPRVRRESERPGDLDGGVGRVPAVRRPRPIRAAHSSVGRRTGDRPGRSWSRSRVPRRPIRCRASPQVASRTTDCPRSTSTRARASNAAYVRVRRELLVDPGADLGGRGSVEVTHAGKILAYLVRPQDRPPGPRGDPLGQGRLAGPGAPPTRTIVTFALRRCARAMPCRYFASIDRTLGRHEGTRPWPGCARQRDVVVFEAGRMGLAGQLAVAVEEPSGERGRAEALESPIARNATSARTSPKRRASSNSRQSSTRGPSPVRKTSSASRSP